MCCCMSWGLFLDLDPAETAVCAVYEFLRLFICESWGFSVCGPVVDGGNLLAKR